MVFHHYLGDIIYMKFEAFLGIKFLVVERWEIRFLSAYIQGFICPHCFIRIWANSEIASSSLLEINYKTRLPNFYYFENLQVFLCWQYLFLFPSGKIIRFDINFAFFNILML